MNGMGRCGRLSAGRSGRAINVPLNAVPEELPRQVHWIDLGRYAARSQCATVHLIEGRPYEGFSALFGCLAGPGTWRRGPPSSWPGYWPSKKRSNFPM